MYYRDDARNPCFWSGVCLNIMATLAKEGTTLRRVMESIFRYFDNGNLWSMEHGIAFPVLKDVLLIMDNMGILSYFPKFYFKIFWFLVKF